MVGRVYLERGQKVTVRARWVTQPAGPPVVQWHRLITEEDAPPRLVELQPGQKAKGAPRNVLIERADGTLVVRSARGLRRIA